MRHNTGPRYGERAAADAARDGRGGSVTSTATATAITPLHVAANSSAACRPCPYANGGSVNAAMATPSGWAVCRAPIARPRSSTANQPITTRPLAAFTEAPAAPARASSTHNTTAPCVTVVSAKKIAARASPVEITTRSPKRSAAAPQAISVSNSPAVGAATTTLAPTRLRCCSARKAGMSIGSPYRNKQVAAWARMPSPRTTHRHCGRRPGSSIRRAYDGVLLFRIMISDSKTTGSLAHHETLQRPGDREIDQDARCPQPGDIAQAVQPDIGADVDGDRGDPEAGRHGGALAQGPAARVAPDLHGQPANAAEHAGRQQARDEHGDHRVRDVVAVQRPRHRRDAQKRQEHQDPDPGILADRAHPHLPPQDQHKDEQAQHDIGNVHVHQRYGRAAAP